MPSRSSCRLGPRVSLPCIEGCELSLMQSQVILFAQGSAAVYSVVLRLILVPEF